MLTISLLNSTSSTNHVLTSFIKEPGQLMVSGLLSYSPDTSSVFLLNKMLSSGGNS